MIITLYLGEPEQELGIKEDANPKNLTPNPRSSEQQVIDTLLASWKRTIEENLFTQRK